MRLIQECYGCGSVTSLSLGIGLSGLASGYIDQLSSSCTYAAP